ncbi:MAG: hypothetical protein D6696_16110 [Acidobacteria bacterium]|nr:MAG: hypothetical protein D6696_16110 [Acidobacteriota bacterium]
MNADPPNATQRSSLWATVLQLLDVGGKLALGIAGVYFGYVFHQQGLEQTEQIEQARLERAESERQLQNNRFAASLIGPLIGGTPKEKTLALALLENVDQELARKISAALAVKDPDAEVRLAAIDALARSDDAETLQVLERVESEAPTENERNKAQQVADDVRTSRAEKLRRNLADAEAFLKAGRKDVAAKYFYEASKYLDEPLDAGELALAKSHFEHGGAEEAADAFNALFQKVDKRIKEQEQ